MNTNTNEMNMKELNLDEMEQVSGADWIEWLVIKTLPSGRWINKVLSSPCEYCAPELVNTL